MSKPNGKGRAKDFTPMKTTAISNRQYSLLKEFIRKPKQEIDLGRLWDQRAFRSFLVRDWITYKPTQGFLLTEKGFAAWKLFEATDIRRVDPQAPLTRYFDAAHYSGTPRRKQHHEEGAQAQAVSDH
jgi:hypothetical protein